MTASRQATSQAHSWSLDELQLEIEIGKDLSGPEDDGFVMKGLNLESAKWDGNMVQSPDLSHPLPNSVLRWRQGQTGGSNHVSVPVYLNCTRSKLLFSLRIDGGLTNANMWYQRGVAITAWNKS